MPHLATAAAAVACLALPLSVSAQGRHEFVVDTPNTAFTFTGSVSLFGISGPIQGTPSNTFTVSGAVSADLTVAASTLVTGQLVAGNTVVTVPTLNAQVPNIFPFLPPLATIQVTGVTVVFTSNPFSVGGGGGFNTQVAAQILSGQTTGSAAGNPINVALAGISSPPQAISGSIVSTSEGFRLQSAIGATFTFNDPGTGATGTLTLNGSLRANDTALAADVTGVSLASGGVQRLRLSAGSARAGAFYLLVGSATGTGPLNVGSVALPLTPDGYLVQTAVAPNSPPLGNSAATLDGLGVSDATFALPPLNLPLAGLTLHHAYVVVSGGGSAIFASNAVAVQLLP